MCRCCKEEEDLRMNVANGEPNGLAVSITLSSAGVKIIQSCRSVSDLNYFG